MADLNVTVYTSPYGIVGAKGADGVLSTSGVITYNGFTGAVQGVSSWNGKTGALQGVCTWNGLTGDVTGVTTGVANNFKALQSFSNGISASGGITFNGILNIGQMLSYAGSDNIKIGELADSTVEIGNLGNSALLSVEGDSESIVLTTNQFVVTATDVAFNNSNITGKLVTSLNGKTGALQGVCTWNGLTGDVTGVTTGVANNFKALQSFSNGISASGGITFNGILNIGQMLSYGGTDDITIGNMAASTVEIGKLSNSALLSVQGDAASIALITDAFSVTATNVVFNNSNITGKLVTSLNGKTGALQGVCAINGFTGTVGLSAGININIATVGNTLTVATTSNVAKTDTAQTFTALQNFSSGISASEIVYPLNTGILPVNSSSTGITGSWFFAEVSGTYYIYFCFGLGWRRVAMNTF
jgi:hypothetical protein